MNCGEILRHLGPYLDSECDAEVTLGITEHLAACEACATRLAREKALEERLGKTLLAPQADDEALWRAVEGRIRPGKGIRPGIWIQAMAAGLLVALAVAWNLLDDPHAPSDLVHAVCADHARMLGGTHPAEVVDTWEAGAKALRGLLPFSLAWAGQAPRDLRLTGARACTLRTQPVALFTAQMGDRPVSVAVLPAEALRIFPETAGEFARRGDTFFCVDGAYKVGLARRDGTLVCVTGESDGVLLKGLAAALAEGLTVAP